jgi:hypothetical protein
LKRGLAKAGEAKELRPLFFFAIVFEKEEASMNGNRSAGCLSLVLLAVVKSAGRI